MLDIRFGSNRTAPLGTPLSTNVLTVWPFRNGEMPFLYGGNVVKAHVGRWSEDCPEHQGVVVLSMNDTPLVCASRSYKLRSRISHN
jgi:ribosome biogenesis protein Nip4